eukprot:COSAG06_NODE_9269_length_1943_cov_1.141540_2_plen_98_part_00
MDVVRADFSAKDVKLCHFETFALECCLHPPGWELAVGTLMGQEHCGVSDTLCNGQCDDIETLEYVHIKRTYQPASTSPLGRLFVDGDMASGLGLQRL